MDLDDMSVLRCVPSMPERSVSWHVAPDGDGAKQLHVDLVDMRFELSAADLTKLIRFLADRRAEMGPGLPASPHATESGEWFEADAFGIGDASALQIGHIWSRVPGVGWVHLPINAKPLRDLAASILSMADDSARPEHPH